MNNHVKKIPPRLSVVVPIHNAEPYLRRCLDSILAQTMTDIEVILVENSSTDLSPAICEEYVRKDARCKMVKGNFPTPAGSRNLGISHASAPFIAFVDSDDYIDAEMYETLLNSVEETGADMALSLHKTERDNGEIISITAFPTAQTLVTGEWVCRQMLPRIVTAAVWVGIWPRSLFQEERFFPDRGFEDHRCSFAWCLRFPKIALVHKAFYHYLVHSGSISNSILNSPRHCRDFFEAEAVRLEWLLQNSRNEADKALQIKMAKWMIGYISNYLSLLAEGHREASKDEADNILKQARRLFKSFPIFVASLKASAQIWFIINMPFVYMSIFHLRTNLSKILKLRGFKNY